MPPYFHRKTLNQQQVAYRFNEYNPNDIQRVYPHLTNRTIYAEAKNCTMYKITSTDYEYYRTLTYANDTEGNVTITIPQDYPGKEGTTYIYRGFHGPIQAHLQSCGDRCLWMWVYKNPSDFPVGSPEPEVLYKCPVYISDVNNAAMPEHHIPNEVVKMAAAAIALHGIYQGLPGNPRAQDYSSYQFYATG